MIREVPHTCPRQPAPASLVQPSDSHPLRASCAHPTIAQATTLWVVGRRIALLLHSLADGSEHVDLLIAPDGSARPDDAREIPTWRCPTRPDCAAPGIQLPLQRIGDHRALYLRLEGPRELDGGRGTVRPLRAGVASEHGDRIDVRWDDGGTSSWSIWEQNGSWTLTVCSDEPK
jgi:hypothetical protein